MNATVYYEPYKLPAGILALAVHGVFFALLYFGFSWQTLPPVTMNVELWQSLPEATGSPAKQKAVEEVKPVVPEEVVKPDIELPDKNKKEIKPVVPHPSEKNKLDAKQGGQRSGISGADQQAAREQAEQVASTGRVVDEFTGKIQGKIKRNVVMPPNVPDDARAEFSVTLLPGGTVLSARLTKSSGNAAYDNAVERAILKSQPLPLPADVAMFNRFRELKLVFKPTE